MSTNPRHELADTAAAAWANYASTVRFGGTSEQRLFAFGVALKAERRLADHDLAQRPRQDREAAARALSGQ